MTLSDFYIRLVFQEVMSRSVCRNAMWLTVEIFGAFDFKLRCIECSVYDIKVPREYIRTHGIHPLSCRSRGTLMSLDILYRMKVGGDPSFSGMWLVLSVFKWATRCFFTASSFRRTFFQLSSPSHIILARDLLRYEICWICRECVQMMNVSLIKIKINVWNMFAKKKLTAVTEVNQ